MFFDPHIRNEIWNEAEIRSKLKGIANADKSHQWIQADLSTPDSSSLGRCFWTIVGKHFQCMRTALYNVNLRTTMRILEELREIIPDNSDLIDLFDRAAGNFERITHRRLDLPGRIFTQTIERPYSVIETPIHQPSVIYREIVQPRPIILTQPRIIRRLPPPPRPVPYHATHFRPQERAIPGFRPPMVPTRSLPMPARNIPMPIQIGRGAVLTSDGRQIPGTARGTR